MARTKVTAKRRRTDGSDDETTGNAQTAFSAMEPRQLPTAMNITTISVQGTVEVAVQRYKAWRRNGCPRDGKCFACGEQSGLLDCHTCRRSFHERCLSKPAAHFFHRARFFCQVCIDRQWHQNEPPLSPPPSPTPQRSRVSLPDHRPTAPQSMEMRELSPASTVANQRASHATSTPLSWSSHHQFASAVTHATMGGTQLRPSSPSIATTTLDAGRSVTGTRGSGLLFPTLSPEAGDAVSLLLHELEQLGDAKRKISQLEELILRLQQDVKINKNAMILAQRNATTAIPLQEHLNAENAKLKKEADRLNQLLDEKKSESERYKAEANSWKTEAQAKQIELDGLRSKLKNLLGG